MNRLFKYVCALLLLPAVLASQQQMIYRPALPNYSYLFPRDHGSHSEFKIEWWYYTGNLRSTDGREFGFELTFFRNGMDRSYENPSVWSIRDLYIAHFAVSDITEKKFYFFEKINRSGPGIAGAATGKLDTWNENWAATMDGELMRLEANAGEAEIALALESNRPPAIHGVGGISQKADGEGHASHYYSLTRLATNGTIRIGTNTFQVTGDSWMDHEFGTNQLAENQAGWDWFGIHLANGTDLMLYRMRNRDGSVDPNSAGTIVSSDAQTRRLSASDFVLTPTREWKSELTGITYPVEWTISLPAEGTDLHVAPVMDQQELVTRRSTGIAYWEGAVRVTGTWQGRIVSGTGYMELTGYSERDRPKV